MFLAIILQALKDLNYTPPKPPKLKKERKRHYKKRRVLDYKLTANEFLFSPITSCPEPLTLQWICENTHDDPIGFMMRLQARARKVANAEETIREGGILTVSKYFS